MSKLKMSAKEQRLTRLEENFRACDGSVTLFLKDVFEFLANRSDIYNDEASGINRIVEIFSECNPNASNLEREQYSVFLPAAVAEEVEITSEDLESFSVDVEGESPNDMSLRSLNIGGGGASDINLDKDLNMQMLEQLAAKPDTVNTSTDSESYNGAVRENYSWSQNICELDVTIKLPQGVTSSKKLKVNTTTDSLTVEYLSDETSQWVAIVKDKLSYKIKPAETVWVMSGGRIRIHLEKHSEKWWNSLLESEPKLDTTALNCTRPMHELPEDQMEKIRELQFNHMQKMAGLPTSDEIKQHEMLRRAWDAPGSPFANTPFDPSVLNK